jgi:tetratricopeptide (TPR) repeat protein
MPIDPKTMMEALPLLIEAARSGYGRFRRWREGDTFERLKRLLDARFDGHEFLYGQDWSFLATSADAADLLDAFFVSQQPLRPGLIPVVARHLSIVSDAAPPTAELAEEVVVAIEAVANEIWDDDTDRVIFELRRLLGPLDELKATTEAIEARLSEMNVEAAPRVITFASAPDDIRPDLERLAKEDGALAVKLYDALMAAPSPGAIARNLIDAAPQWTTEGPAAGTLWHVLARMAGRYGMWEQAEMAYIRALDLGYARRAQALANAAEAAGIRGDEDRHGELLSQAAREDPTEPGVAILEAALLVGGDARLARLADAAEPTPEDAAAVWVARASAHLLENRFADAHAAVARAKELNARSPHAQEIEAVITLFEGREALGGVVDVARLREAAESFLDLRRRVARLGRINEAALLLGRAVETSYVAGERERARVLLEEAASDPALDDLDLEARVDLAQHAVNLHRPELAQRLLPETATSEEARFVRATVKTMAPATDEDLRQGVAELDEIVASTGDDNVKGQAALSRLGAAILREGIEWSDAAEAAIRALGRPQIADGLRAQYLQRRGDRQAAEAMLLASDDPRALDLLVVAAVEAGDYDLALARSERALSTSPTPVRQIEHAEILSRSGRAAEAREQLAGLRRDPEMPLEVRAKAYYLSVHEAQRARQYDEARALAEEWMELEPQELGAAWVRVDALLWLGRAREAVEVVRSAGLDPTEVGEARLLGHVYLRGLPAEEALPALIDLSDRFDRADEHLEGLVVVAWSNARGAVSTELDERGALSMVEFPERFPDSRAQARAVSIDEFLEILRQQAAAAESLDAMGHDVIAGRIPVAVWSLAAGRSAVQMWSSLRVLPIAVADETASAHDAAGAEQAYGRGAVWDPSALTVSALLEEAAREAVRRALPRSVLAQSVMQDVDFTAVGTVDERAAEDETRIAWDAAAAAPVTFVRPADEIARERQIVRTTLQLANDLEVVADLDASRATAADHLVPEVRDVQTMVQAGVGATLAVALRQRLPVYCDDRVLRVLYREAGVPVFGTIALLACLEKRGTITEAELDAAVAGLEAAGAIDLG